MEPIKTEVNVGKYKFIITDNTLSAREEIYCRNFKIGGNHSDCVNVSISYKNNEPISASMPHIIYDPECSMDTPLDRGGGSVIMIKTLLQHIHAELPSITEMLFEDKSNIECASEIQKNAAIARKRGTNIYPIPLYYFSIAFNGKTWYEKHFNARQKNESKHTAYKTKIASLLYSEEIKKSTEFIEFLRIAQPPVEIIEELEAYYNKSATFSDFFTQLRTLRAQPASPRSFINIPEGGIMNLQRCTSIPHIDRCRLVRDWISTFMEHHLHDLFSNKDWVIDIPFLIKGGKRNTKKYYCPKGRIRHTKTYKDFGVDVNDI